MLRLRLARGGHRNRPVWKVIATDSRKRRDTGAPLERLGSYDPLPDESGSRQLRLNVERVKYWLQLGAQPSERVAKILSDFDILPEPHRKSLVPARPPSMPAPRAAPPPLWWFDASIHEKHAEALKQPGAVKPREHPPVGPKLRRARRALVVESDPILKARLQRLQQARENYEVPSALLPPTAVKTDSSALKATGSTAAAPSPLPAGAHVVPTAVAVQAALQQLLEASQARATAEKEMRSSKRFSSAKVEGDGEDGKAPFDAVSGIGLHRPYELGLAAMASNQPGGMSPMGLAQPRAKWVAPPPPPVEEGTENTEGEEGAALEEGAAAASEGSEEAAKAEGAKQE